MKNPKFRHTPVLTAVFVEIYSLVRGFETVTLQPSVSLPNNRACCLHRNDYCRSATNWRTAGKSPMYPRKVAEKTRELEELAHSTSVARMHDDGAMTLH